MATHNHKIIGKQNSHILNTITDAYKAALDLAEQQFDILDIQIGARNPKIEIAYSPRKCRTLHGAVRMICSNNNGKSHVMTCVHKGAQIEWRQPA